MLGNEWHVNVSVSVVSGMPADIIISIYGAVSYLGPLSGLFYPEPEDDILGGRLRWEIIYN